MKSLYFMFVIVVSVTLKHNNLFSSANEEIQDRAFRIQQQPCTDRHGNQGMCMFQWECRQRKGIMLATCLDRFLFGTCCKLPSSSQISSSPGNGKVSNSMCPTERSTTTSASGVTNTVPPQLLPNHSSSENAHSDFVLTSDENDVFSQPSTFVHHIANMTTPTYSTPDIDKIFNQFLGSVLTNYSKLSTVVAVTNPTVFQNGEVTTATPTPSLDTPTTTRPPSLVVKDDVMTSLSSWSVTLPTSPSIDHNNVMATTTLRTSLPSTSSSPSSSTWSSVQHHTATVNDVDYPDVDFETTANAIINDWSAGGQLSTDPQTVATTLPVAIDVTIDTTENPEVSLQAQEYDNGWTYETHPEDELGTDFYDTENPDEEEEGQSPLPETLQASKTTKSTTTTTPPTTTMRQFNYKKGDENKSLLSSWMMWSTTFLIHLFAAIPNIIQNLLRIRRSPECSTSPCGLHESPTVDSRVSALPNEAYCGVRPLVPSGRIVGGTNSRFGEWPWQVLVKEATWLGLFVKNKCGGVLLNTRYVITAAHCQPSFLASLLVVFGENDLTVNNKELKPLQRNVRRVITHRKFNALTFDNDLALLEMDRPIEYKPHIVPICLPPDGFDVTSRVGTVTGWGRIKYGGRLPSHLQQVDVPIIPNRKCQQMFLSAGHIKSIGDKFLCAGYQEGVKDSCEGDSGGPLVMEDDDGRWILVGTVSHGIKCAYPNLPGIYINVSAYKSWIQRIINS